VWAKSSRLWSLGQLRLVTPLLGLYTFLCFMLKQFPRSFLSISGFFLAVIAFLFSAQISLARTTTPTTGTLDVYGQINSIKIGPDGKRHAFPNSQVYFTWYADFSGVQIIGKTELATIPLGANITYKPGKKMVKFPINTNVYTVSKGGLLRPILLEAVAIILYGADWNKKIDDISEAFYTNYVFGAVVNGSMDFNSAAVEASVMTSSDSLVM